jgi:hypothetical protein
MVNIDEAITAHAKWKMKLTLYLSKPDRSLQASVVEADNQCELGKWLHGEGRKYIRLPEFLKLVTDHAKFHKTAAEIIRKADSGQQVANELALGAKSNFASASSAIVMSLMAMKSKL